MTRHLITALIVTCLISLPAWAGGDIYVATTGNDTTGNGSIGTPYATIAKAITAITDSNGGWNIILRGGTYNEHDLLIGSTRTGTSEAWNTMRSYPGEWAIIDGQHNCQANNHAVIYNGAFYPDGTTPSLAQYWIFERLGVTGGGLDAAHGGDSEDSAGGIWWVRGPVKIRYCEVYDNVAVSQNENPAGIVGVCWQNATIEFNYVHDNGSTGNKSGNDRQIMTYNQEEYADYHPWEIPTWSTMDNIIRYNYVDSSFSSVGIGMKASNRLVPNVDGIRDVNDTTYQSHGDNIHHNIVKGSLYSAIFWQNDWAQIYNNIVEMGVGNGEAGAINTRRVRSAGVDTIYPCVYNNTIIGGFAGIGNDMDGGHFTTFQYFCVNNLIDSSKEEYPYVTSPISLYGLNDDYQNYVYPWTYRAWGGDFSWPESFDTSEIKIDRNYIYRSLSTHGDVFLGKPPRTSGGVYTYTSYEQTFNGVDLFKQEDQESGSNKLYIDDIAIGADKYRTVSTHNLGETGKTVAANGIGGDHPYLSGVTIPSYIGATNPSDDDWVAGVLAMDADYFTAQTAGSDPTWVEGSGSSPSTPSITGVGLSNAGLH